ncbi:MAG: hypothetical protein IKR11_11575 [Solobacterium sp.]|nr:hypothetical protein [Solobacterium sp.]
MIKAVSILLVVFAAFMFYGQFMQSRKAARVSNQLIAFLMEGQYDAFEKMIHEEDMYLSDYSLCYMQFLKEILQDNRKKADILFDQMDGIRSSDKQKAAFYAKAMPYYLSYSDKERCRHCYEKIMSLKGNKDLKKNSGRFYRIFMENDISDKEDLIRELKTADGEEKQIVQKMLKRIETIEKNHE